MKQCQKQTLRPHFQNNNHSVRDEVRETREQGGERRRKEKERRSVFLFKCAESLERVEPAVIFQRRETGEAEVRGLVEQRGFARVFFKPYQAVRSR